MLYIGVDLGTSACKLLLSDERGSVLRIVRKPYPVDYPRPGWSEQRPSLWWDAVCTGIPELLEGVDASQVGGIGCAGQMHGLVMLDAKGEVIRPAILWNDNRTIQEVDFLNHGIGTDCLLAYTGNIAYAGFTAPKILWVRKYEPENFARIAHIMLPKDYVNYRLTGYFATDVSDASGTLLFDVANRSWSDPMLRVCGIEKSQLPDVFESYQSIGCVRPEVARDLGLGDHVDVAAGAGDNAAAAIGTGAVGSGRMNISLGTSGTVFIPTDGFAEGVGDQIHSFCHADGGWHMMGCILSAASCNEWWARQVLGTDDLAALQQEIDPDACDASLPYFLPYLMGERTPLNDSLARGAFVGMSMSTSQQDMTRAVLEGVAFAVCDSVELAREAGTNPKRVTVCGGGAKSSVWLQMLADILDTRLVLPETEQGPGFGGAILAAVAADSYDSVANAIEKVVQLKPGVSPNPKSVDGYRARYSIWKGLYPALKDSMRAMAL